MYNHDRRRANHSRNSPRTHGKSGGDAGLADYGNFPTRDNGTAAACDDGFETAFPDRGAGGVLQTTGPPPATKAGARPERLHTPNEHRKEQGDGSNSYTGAGRSARPASRFLDGPAPEFDDPLPEPPVKRGLGRTVGFFLLMAVIGSSSGALWFYYGPDLSISSTEQVDKTAESLNRLVDEQTKLVQSVIALRIAQDALQKSIAGREQELQRLSTETAALRAEVNGLRLQIGQTARPAPTASKKAKTERKPPLPHEQPAAGELNSKPMTLTTPPSQ